MSRKQGGEAMLELGPGAQAALDPALLRWTCDPRLCTEPERTWREECVFGQARALAALRFGLEIDGPGYNVYVSGAPGCGRMSAVRALLETITPRARPKPYDYAYAHNFDDPARPKLLRFPSGTARRFQRAIGELVAAARAQLPVLFDSDSFRRERAALIDKSSREDQERFETFRKKIEKDGLDLVMVEREDRESRPELGVIVEGRPVHPLALRSDRETAAAWLRAREAKDLERALSELESAYAKHAEELEGIVRSSRRTARTLSRDVSALEASTSARLIGELIAELLADFPSEELRGHLDRVQKHMVEHLALFKGPGDEELPHDEPDPEAFEVYEINVLLDTTGQTRPPIVFEPNPTFSNLVGALDAEVDAEGMRHVDFRGIRAGALLRANGGYLVMYANDVFSEPGVWRVLVRALRARLLEIRGSDAALMLVGAPSLMPQAIPLELKVILVGDEELHSVLAEDDDFQKTFKVKAEFDTSVENTAENVASFGAVLGDIAARESLARPTPEAIAAIAEHAARASGSRRRISTRFGELAGVLREASYWARGGAIDGASARAAIRARRERHNLMEAKLDELLDSRLLVVKSAGVEIGQINGLATIGVEPEHFGRPQRITVTAGPGREGIINIDREAQLSGSTYDKAVLILAGYLRRKYGGRRRVALSASIAFEQSYLPVDGDSASLAELYCLLSAIAEAPVSAALAVTGSIDQLGAVQAVGGVNEKIEAFFRICSHRGLSGDQGCVIPRANVDSLMLEPEVISACAERRFSIYAIEHADDGIPLLFGIGAGELHARVAQRLGNR